MSNRAEQIRRVTLAQQAQRDGLTDDERQARYDEHVLRQREQARQWHVDSFLGPLVVGINEVLGVSMIALRWRSQDKRLGRPNPLTSDAVCIVDAKTDKALSVYMNPDTMRKRLEFAARILGADLVKEASK